MLESKVKHNLGQGKIFTLTVVADYSTVSISVTSLYI